MQQALGRPQSEPLPQTNKQTKNQHYITAVSQAGIFHLKKEVKYVLKKKLCETERFRRVVQPPAVRERLP